MKILVLTKKGDLLILIIDTEVSKLFYKHDI